MDIDVASLLIGFLVGLIVFQVRNVKKILEALGFLGTMLFILTLINTILNTRNLNLNYVFKRMVTSFFVGEILGNLVYLIGANISRYIQFGTLSLKILIYIMLIALILIIFSNL
ncbi:MAG: hypothetical protein DRK00_09005 [Thermoprotei archaeon]|nr:MAG: hypothetical protein DRK00_09005 [Thermoprotei archaeon]